MANALIMTLSWSAGKSTSSRASRDGANGAGHLNHQSVLLVSTGVLNRLGPIRAKFGQISWSINEIRCERYAKA